MACASELFVGAPPPPPRGPRLLTVLPRKGMTRWYGIISDGERGFFLFFLQQGDSILHACILFSFNILFHSSNWILNVVLCAVQ